MMGPRTDEFNKVRAEKEELAEELDEAQDELRQGVWQRRAKAIAIVIGAVATAATAVLAHFQPETVAKETAGVTATALQRLQDDQETALKTVQARCEAAAEQAAAKTKAEADSVRTLLLGYLLAQRRAGSSTEVAAALGKVAKQLGKSKVDRLVPQDKPVKALRRADTSVKALRKISKGGE